MEINQSEFKTSLFYVGTFYIIKYAILLIGGFIGFMGIVASVVMLIVYVFNVVGPYISIKLVNKKNKIDLNILSTKKILIYTFIILFIVETLRMINIPFTFSNPETFLPNVYENIKSISLIAAAYFTIVYFISIKIFKKKNSHELL